MDKARKSAGAVTVRHLARETSAVIDLVRERDAPMLITRNGIPVASIQPLDFDPWGPPVPRTSVAEAEEPEIDLDALKLDETLKQVLPRISDPFTAHDVARATGDAPGVKAMVSCTHLELKGLARKTMRGYHLTRLGRRVAEQLRGS